jgi:spermidine/putrescine transport system ATP-binding protein
MDRTDHTRSARSPASGGRAPIARVMVGLSGVSRTYPGAREPALFPVELDIREGEFFSILGPSGSGKTTTLRLIAGFEKPDSGTIQLDGAVVNDVAPDKRDVNTVFQNYALFPHMTVAENVGYPLRMRGVGRSEASGRIAEALAMVEMVGFETRLPHQLSGGQRQRIALARALVGRPKVLLLDEPLGALDLRLRHQMQHVLSSLQDRLGITFIYVTHDQSEALSMSDRVALMNKGRIEQIGTPEDLYYAPRNEFVARFVGKSNLIDVTLTAAGSVYEAEIAGRRFEVQAEKAGRAKFVLRCESVTLSRTADVEGMVCVPAVVQDVLFVGNNLEVSVRCNDTDIIALVPARRERTFAAGDSVYCCFVPGDGVVLHG